MGLTDVRAPVDHSPAVTQRRWHQRRDPQVRPSSNGVARAELVVTEITGPSFANGHTPFNPDSRRSLRRQLSRRTTGVLVAVRVHRRYRGIEAVSAVSAISTASSRRRTSAAGQASRSVGPAASARGSGSTPSRPAHDARRSSSPDNRCRHCKFAELTRSPSRAYLTAVDLPQRRISA